VSDCGLWCDIDGVCLPCSLRTPPLANQPRINYYIIVGASVGFLLLLVIIGALLAVLIIRDLGVNICCTKVKIKPEGKMGQEELFTSNERKQSAPHIIITSSGGNEPISEADAQRNPYIEDEVRKSQNKSLEQDTQSKRSAGPQRKILRDNRYEGITQDHSGSLHSIASPKRHLEYTIEKGKCRKFNEKSSSRYIGQDVQNEGRSQNERERKHSIGPRAQNERRNQVERGRMRSANPMRKYMTNETGSRKQQGRPQTTSKIRSYEGYT
jgi:hypothetical protein